jgi:hypothetical protein
MCWWTIAASKITQGVTTEITGEGTSIAPLDDRLLEDLQDSAKKYGVALDWRSLDEYLRRYDRARPAINLGTFAQLLGSLQSSDTGGEFRTEQARVCGLVGESSYCGKSSIDRSRRELPILEENAVAGDHSLVERQARLGAVPLNKFINGVSVAPLGLGRTKAVQNRRFAVIQIR